MKQHIGHLRWEETCCGGYPMWVGVYMPKCKKVGRQHHGLSHCSRRGCGSITCAESQRRHGRVDGVGTHNPRLGASHIGCLESTICLFGLFPVYAKQEGSVVRLQRSNIIVVQVVWEQTCRGSSSNCLLLFPNKASLISIPPIQTTSTIA